MSRVWGRAVASACTTLAAGIGCSAPDPAGSSPEMVRDTVGDTIVVRTLSGSVWGPGARLEPEVSIGTLEGEPEYLFGQIISLAVGQDGTLYVVDGQVPDLRAYSPDGKYLRTIGRPGEGPGEIKRPDGGLQVLSDGRLVVRDPGNARLQVYSPDGEPLATWPHRGGLQTSSPMPVDQLDNVYPLILIDAEADIREWRTALVRVSPDGVPGDTLRIPDSDFEPAAIEARVESGGDVSVARNGVPFSPTESWLFHPNGYFVHGISNRYALTLLKADAPLRIERNADPIPVAAGERAEEEEWATRQMRQMDPSWRWNGPAIPETKPPYRALFAARDGRIWVQVSRPGVEVGDPAYDPSDPRSMPDAWREPTAFDVFDEDGTYLGAVSAPDGFATHPTPVFDGDRVWAVSRDDLDVQRVVRFRIVRTSPT
jgi:hypothetical protein